MNQTQLKLSDLYRIATQAISIIKEIVAITLIVVLMLNMYSRAKLIRTTETFIERTEQLIESNRVAKQDDIITRQVCGLLPLNREYP